MKNLSQIFEEKLVEIFGDELPSRFAVAVSGGVDSVALTMLLEEFCRDKKIKLFAATVDHKVRKNSSHEALELNKILAKKKISHEILEIPVKKIPQKNIEAELRELRYKLLYDFCEKNKIEHLFLGHHAGDVAENFLIRLFRGSGLDGLSTMAEVGEYKKIKLVRPLLDFEKDDLKKFLVEKKIKWFEDETNDDEKFLRNKIRKFFESFEEKNLIQKRIKNAADNISEMRDFVDEVLLREAYIAVRFEGNYFLLNHAKFKKIPHKIGLKILALILMEVGGREYKPRLEKLQRFYERIIATQNHKKKNFYGCMVSKFDGEFLKVYPEKEGERGDKLNLNTILKKIF